jgi:hypothetical protein
VPNYVITHIDSTLYGQVMHKLLTGTSETQIADAIVALKSGVNQPGHEKTQAERLGVLWVKQALLFQFLLDG